MKPLPPCIFLWNWLIVDIPNSQIQNCCKTQSIKVESDLVPDHFLNHPKSVVSRENILLNREDTTCSHCSHLERDGIVSPRMSWQGSQSFVNANITTSRVDSKLTPIRLEIILSSLCNLECIYCGPERSTQWQKRLNLNHHCFKNKSFEDLFWNWFADNISSFDQISLSGGEPLLSSKTHDALILLEKKYSETTKPTQFTIISNISIPTDLFSKEVDRILSYDLGKKIIFEFSNESIEKKAEYIRWGMNWSVFNKNLSYLASKRDFILGAQITLNALSISSLPDYINYLFLISETHSVEIWPIVNIAKSPNHLDPEILPSFFSRYIYDTIQIINKKLPFTKNSHKHWETYKNFLLSLAQHISKNDTTSIKLSSRRLALKEYLVSLDQSRKTDFFETFPEFQDFFQTI